MYIFVGNYEDDGMGPPLSEIVCSVCGCSNSVIEGSYVSYVSLPYKVLKSPKKCANCGHTDSIIANGKAAFIELSCFSGAYNLEESRQWVQQQEEKRANESIEYRKSYIFKEREREREKRDRRIKLILFIPAIIFLLIIAVISISSFIIFLVVYWGLGLIITNPNIHLYVSITFALLSVELIAPFVTNNQDMTIKLIAWPIQIYKFLELSQLMRCILFIVITIIDLSNSALTLSENTTWLLIKSNLYPSILTALLLDGFIKNIFIRIEKKRKENRIKESKEILNNLKNMRACEENNRKIDDNYLDILLSYFCDITLSELRQFNIEIYNLFKRDFEEFFSCPRLMIDETEVKVSGIVDLYNKQKSILRH